MKEQIVSFAVAELAKAKGFNHVKANAFGDTMCYQLPKGKLMTAVRGNVVSGYILAPTQSLLQKWLREECNVYVYALEDIDQMLNRTFYFTISDLFGADQVDFDVNNARTYEEALEEGLEKALSL